MSFDFEHPESLNIYKDHIRHHYPVGAEKRNSTAMQTCPWCSPKAFERMEPKQLQKSGCLYGTAIYSSLWETDPRWEGK